MMMSEPSRVMRNGIIAAVVGTVVGGLILHFIPQFSGFLTKFISWIWTGMSSIWTALITEHSIAGWMFLIIGLFALVGLSTICVIVYMALWNGDKSTYMDYTEDMLYGAKWRWSWIKGRISNLWCFCPICDAQLVYAEGLGETRFVCEQCPPDGSDHLYTLHGRIVATVKGGDKHYAVGAAEREILRRIRIRERTVSDSQDR